MPMRCHFRVPTVREKARPPGAPGPTRSDDPSLPWIAGRRTSVRVTRLEAQKSLDQTGNRPSAYDPAMRVVLSLMYPFRTSAA